MNGSVRLVGWILGISLFYGSTVASQEEFLTDIRRDIRDDGMEEKSSLFQEAYNSGDYDLARSIAESMQWTLDFQKQLKGDIGEVDIDSNHFEKVDELPSAWKDWAKGWEFFKTIDLSETQGIERTGEPVDIVVAFKTDQTTDLYREIRVAYVNKASGTLEEVHSQVYDSVRRGSERRCHVVFFADVPANGKATYLIFYGNRYAELPEYPSDLQVEGEGYNLEITTKHYIAKLSEQTGQLERVRYKRQHGLELYAGGKGHGEPPTIDWSNDYVDQDHYQKLRIRNWAEAPNYEVVRGPLCIKVRRWGFPHSPIHPLFTPTRMHIDQTYTFYAGQDYFMKEGTMKAIKDFDFSTMRDDEWVLSGYSFNHLLWFDEEGRLQEGPVPADQNESMWGVGFYQDQSRDAFIAMWLDHTAQGWSEILKRNGTPTLHYHQHGQLWSRYPVGSGDLVAKRGDFVSQRNAYLVAPYPEEEPAEKIEQVRERLLHPVSAALGKAPQPTEARAEGALARDGETEEIAPLKDEMWAALRDVRDEQLYRIDANVVDLGYIYDLKVRDGVAEVLMTMPHKGRPIYEYLVFQGGGRNTEGIRERLLHLDGVKDVLVDFTWEPAWDVSRMTDKGLRAVGLEP